MQSPEQKPQPPFITPEILTKANFLGVTLFILFGVSTILVFFLLSIFGWGNLTRVLIAMFLGPIIVSVIFGIWFASQKPAILNTNPPATTSDNSTSHTNSES